jgi:hypothetical protein
MKDMLIGYYGPLTTTWAIDGTGAAFMTDVLLTNGSVGESTRIRWLSASPDITDYVALQCTFTTPFVPRAGAMLGLEFLTEVSTAGDYSSPVTLGAGVKVEIRGKRSGDSGFPYSLGGNSLTQLSLVDPDGSTSVPWLFDDGLDEIIGYEIRIFNDRNGVTWADPETFVDIGEASLRACVEVCAANGWSAQRVQTTETKRTLGQQVHRVPRPSYIRATLKLAPHNLAETRGEGLSNDMDLQKVEAALDQAFPCLFIPIYTGEDGSFSASELHRTMVFGVAETDPIAHVTNSGANHRMYTTGYVVSQIPPRPIG